MSQNTIQSEIIKTIISTYLNATKKDIENTKDW